MEATNATGPNKYLACAALLAVLLSALHVCIAQPASEPGPDAQVPDVSFEEFAAQKGLAPDALADELGIGNDTDLSTPIRKVLKDAGLNRGDLQAAVRKLSAPGQSVGKSGVAVTGEAPAPGPGQELDPSAAMQLPFVDFAQAKGVDADRFAEALGLPDGEDLSRPLGVILQANGLTRADVQKAMADANPLAAESARKDWRRIRLKFGLWVCFFIAAMVLLSVVRITKPIRLGMLLLATVIFGVWLGVEPNAPGTVKDALVLYGAEGVVFRPRLMAFIAFILMSIIGNKVFCGWGCHFGTLQDLCWQTGTAKVKPPFWLSNTVRAVFLLTVAGFALGLGRDIMEPIDPFRIFRFGAISAVAVAVVVLIAGVWVYRPWCTFLCPFGFVSWIGERISLCKPRVNHTTCIDCHACERVCPTHSMEGIRGKRAFAQDCFACGSCMAICPVTAIRWGIKPPPGEESSTGDRGES